MNSKELEDRFATISNRFSELLDIRKDIEDINDEIDIERALRKKIQENLEVVKKQHKDEVAGVGKQIVEGILDIDRAMDKFRDEIKEIKDKQEQLFLCVASMRGHIDVAQQDVKKLKEPIDKLRVDLDKDISHLDNLSNILQEKDKNLHKKADYAILKTTECLELYTANDVKIRDIKKDIDELKDTLLKIGIDFMGDIGKHERAIRDLKASIDTKVTVAPNLPQDSVTHVELANVSSKLESIALDAKNASLKAGNSAIQIELINKKLENLQLTVKSFELQSKGA